MSQILDCYELSGSRVLKGIPGQTSPVFNNFKLPIAEARNGRLLHAIPINNEGERFRVQGMSHGTNESSRTALLYVEVQGVDFCDDPSFGGLNIWTGIEWHNKKPVWKKIPTPGRRNTSGTRHERAELWLLSEDDKLCVTDHNKTICVLELKNGKPQYRDVDVEEIVEYFSQRGQDFPDIEQVSIKWAYQNLLAIQKRNRHLKLASQIAPIQRRLKKSKGRN